MRISTGTFPAPVLKQKQKEKYLKKNVSIIENWQLRHVPGTPHCTGFCRALPICVKKIYFENHQKPSKLIN